MNEKVECHSGFTYAERPVAFLWEGRRCAIREIIKEWRIPGGHCFKVLTDEQLTFELFYGELYDEWRINPV
jgi:hypothetical protein